MCDNSHDPIQIAGAIVMSLSTNTGIFCAGRAVMGFGTSTALAVAPTLLQEIAHPRFRAQISCFFKSCSWNHLNAANKTDTSIYYFAAIISAGTCMGCMSIVGDNSWRIPCWVQVVGPALTLMATATMPESPRVSVALSPCTIDAD